MYLSFWYFKNINETCYVLYNPLNIYVDAHIFDDIIGIIPDHIHFIIKLRSNIYRIFGFNQFLLYDITRKYKIERAAKIIQRFYRKYRAHCVINKLMPIYIKRWLSSAYRPPDGKLYIKLRLKYI